MAAAAPQKGSFEMAKSILIVEDDNNIADLLRLYLEKEGYQTAHRASTFIASCGPIWCCWT